MIKTKSILLLLSASLSLHGADTLSNPIETAASGATETPAQHDARMQWFRQARFGMFIHWGLYAVPAGEWNGKKAPWIGEWIMHNAHVPVADYEKLAGQFNPVKFDAKQWVAIARDAGVKYIVITSKHHDGFSMFDSKVSDYTIVKSTPFKRDPMKELADACKDAGVTFCFYHSIMDWHHPDAQRIGEPNYNESPLNPRFDQYVQNYLKPQLKELLSNYRRIGILWFDGEWIKDWTPERGRDLYDYCRALQPDLIINNRVGKARSGMSGMNGGTGAVGDYGTPEQEIPATGFGRGVDWESCMTMNDTWGFRKDDHHWKSTTTILRMLINCSSKGGNFLLNVGPTAEGVIPVPSVERLAEIGKWMKVNGESIYGTTAGPFSRKLPWGRCTTKVSGDTATLYLHVFDWPADGELLVPGLKNKIKRAYLLADPAKKELTATNSEQGLSLSLPPDAPDKISSTVVLEFSGAPVIETALNVQKSDGSIELAAADARPHGSTLHYEFEPDGTRDNIGFWTEPDEWADWEFKVTQPGKFAVYAEIAAEAAGSFDLSVASQTLRCVAPVTNDYGKFERVKLGVVEIQAAGPATLAVRPVKEGWEPMNLKRIRLEDMGPDSGMTSTARHR